MSMCLSVRSHNSKTTWVNFTKFLHVACGCGSTCRRDDFTSSASCHVDELTCVLRWWSDAPAAVWRRRYATARRTRRTRQPKPLRDRWRGCRRYQPRCSESTHLSSTAHDTNPVTYVLLSGAVLGKIFRGTLPSSFGRQQRLSEITIEPITSNMWKSWA